MIELPAEIQQTLELAIYASDEKLRQMAFKLLSSKLSRYGLRWEYFV